MILNGNARGGAGDLARHLMKGENEHIEVHELRGFTSQNLEGAFNEAYALSCGTRCKQFLYSLSLNPPQNERVGVDAFESAIDRVERDLGLTGQPRAIVFHEKEGRRHAHAVWSRIKVDEMKAVQLSFDRTKLKSISRELFLEHGWKMPPGLVNAHDRSPRNFDLATWQQAKRSEKDPKAIKAAFQDAWVISDSKSAFINALEERGFKVARGDRRGFVGVDLKGEVYSIPRMTGIKTKDVRKRLGNEDTLRSVAQAKREFAEEMLTKVENWQEELEAQNQKLRADFQKRRRDFVQRQRTERRSLKDKHEKRLVQEAKARQGEFRKGFRGLWDFLRGHNKKLRKRHEQEAQKSVARDRKEMDSLIFKQLSERQNLNVFKLKARERNAALGRELRQDAEIFRGMKVKSETSPASIEGRGRPRGPTPER